MRPEQIEGTFTTKLSELERKMKVFKFSVKYLRYVGLGIYSKRAAGLQNQFLRSIQSYLLLAVFLGPMIPGSFAFILYNKSDFDLVSGALITICGGLASLCSFVSMGISISKIKWLLNECEVLADKGIFCHVQFKLFMKIFCIGELL